MGAVSCTACCKDTSAHVVERDAAVPMEGSKQDFPAAVHQEASPANVLDRFEAQQASVPREDPLEDPPEPKPPWKPLCMTIVSARNLRNADFSLPFLPNYSDPYCICEIEGKPLSRSLTDVIRDNLNPVWKHECQFRDFEEGDRFIFKVFDRDSGKFKSDDALGHSQLSSAQFFPNGFDGELLLQDAGKNRKAYLKIRIAPAEREARPPRRTSVVRPPLSPESFAPSTLAAGSSPTAPASPSIEPVESSLTVALPQRTASYLKAAGSTGNVNKPGDYLWLRDVLQRLAANDADALNVRNLETKVSFTPVLFVIGGCPNALCGMQAVMFAVDDKKCLDFWWVKPSKDNGAQLETETLNRHASGKHKNDPGRSKPFYQPLADLFQQGALVGDWRFGLDTVDHNGKVVLHCTLRNEKENTPNVYLQLLWQEDWTTNPFARSKYIKGKLMYQRQLGDGQYWCRQYEIHDGHAVIAVCEEGPINTCIPSEEIKELWDMSELIEPA